MQARPNNQKPKFKLKDFAVSGNYAINKFTYQPNDGSCKLYCICNQFTLSKSRKCSKCGQSYHSCVNFKTEAVKNWQCLHCESVYMDPIYCPQAILLQTFFKTETIVQYGNHFQFVFYLNQQQVKKPIEIRSLQDGRTGLAWPMQGQFYLNKQQNPDPIIDIKPLLKNSNRKHRKQQALFLPEDKVKVGKNILTFSIPKINLALYESKYQIEIKNIYFLGIYSINKLTKQELIKKTFQISKLQKAASLQFLKESSGFGQLSVQKTVISLECPYMKSRIKIPVRGKQCSHYTCICLETLILSRTGMTSRQWFCPICSCPINEPVIDMFIFSILNDGSAGIKVALDVEGNYQWIVVQEDNLSLSSDSFDKKLKPVSKNNEAKQINEGGASSNLPISSPQAPTSLISNIPLPNSPANQPVVNKPQQKIIQAIDLDDDDPVIVSAPVPPPPPVAILPVVRNTVAPVIATIQAPSSVASKSLKPRDCLASKSVPPPNLLEIMIPEQMEVQTKKKRKQALTQALKQSIKEKKDKQVTETVFVRQNPKKSQFFITDIREIIFKPLNYSEFSKKYFSLEYNRSKINDELRLMFKEVI